MKFVDTTGETRAVMGEVGRRWSHSPRNLKVGQRLQLAYDRATPTNLVYLDVAPVTGLNRLSDNTFWAVIVAALLAVASSWPEKFS